MQLSLIFNDIFTGITKTNHLCSKLLLCCRYIEYMCDMMAEEPIVPHCKPIIIRSIVMTPVPLFNKQRNGCRPFCEVYVGDERVLTTSQEYDRMKSVDTS